ncbi:MAG: hypothetical protein V4819_24105 [Verrucomicrobiota bacterium]
MTVSTCLASHEGGIAPSSLVFRVEKLDFEVAVERDKEGTLTSMILTLDGTSYSVPKEDLAGSGANIDLSSIRLLASFGTSGSKVEKAMMQRFAISFSCGPITVNEEAGREVKTFDEVRFEFDSGKLDCRKRAITRGDSKSLWQLFRKDSGEKEVVGGPDFTGALNPYADDLFR